MERKIGFIGAGNMGNAMIKGIVKANIIPSNNIYVNDANKEKLDELVKSTGVVSLNTNKEVIENSDIIILAVKPNMVKVVLEESKAAFTEGKLLLSIAVGIPIKFYKQILGNDVKIIRAMPNTPALVGEGMTLISYEEEVTKDDSDYVSKILSCTGKVEYLDEKLMSEVTALTGSSPAYVYMFIEAMADAAVLSGIPRQLAYKLAAQSVLGSAKMVLDTGTHPGELKDQVCSPAGTTIEAVATLEKNGFRYAIIDAMNECTKKAREIGKSFN